MLVCSPPNQDVRCSFAPRRSAKIILEVVQPHRMLILPGRQYAIVLYREQDSLGRIIRNKVECFRDKKTNVWTRVAFCASANIINQKFTCERAQFGQQRRLNTESTEEASVTFSSALQMARCVNCASWVENVDLSATESAPPTQFNAAAESGSL